MSNLIDRLREVFPERYEIKRELGSGGAATVFLAEDTKHHRPVAVKILRPELSASVGVERFKREIEIAAKLQHPNIVPVYDSGNAGGLMGYTMPFIEGESLRKRLEADGALPINEAVEIVKDVASALSYAHKHGVVHRDIKPANILLSGGRAVVADFGIAWVADAAGVERLTGSGRTIGTPSYLSPEQAAGERDIDQRCDIYSLGCVLYELLAGKPAFSAPSVQAVLAQHITQMPREITLLRADVPENVAAALAKAMAKVPDDRFATAADFAAAITATTPSGNLPIATTRAQAGEQSIAVLPFTNMSADADNEYFSDGMTEEIINRLAQVPSLRVAARTSTFAFKGKELDIREIGEKLEVGTVLEGSVRKAGSKLRVTVQLIEVATGYHLWSERYDREMEDVFAVQDEIARAIADKLKVELLGTDDAPIVKPGTDNPDAYVLYLKGRYCWNKRTSERLKQGIKHFEQAIEVDETYALAYAGLADSYSLLAWYRYLNSAEAYTKVKWAAEKAVEIDDSLAEAHTSLAYAKFLYDWDWAGAEEGFKRAIDRNPEYPTVRHWYAEVLMATGRLDEAFEQMNRGHALDPMSLSIGTGVGWVSYIAGRYDEAIKHYLSVLELDPGFVILPWFLGPAYVENGMYAPAVALYKVWIARSGGHPGFIALLAYAYAAAGHQDDALRSLAELEKRAQTESVPADYMALAHTGLGNVDLAFDWLERAVEQRTWSLVLLKVDPAFRSLRSDPRFSPLLEQIGLVPTLV